MRLVWFPCHNGIRTPSDSKASNRSAASLPHDAQLAPRLGGSSRDSNLSVSQTFCLAHHYIGDWRRAGIDDIYSGGCSGLRFGIEETMSAHPQTTFLLEPVPQLDLAAQYAVIGAEIRSAVEGILASQQFILGREGSAFEQEIAQLCGVAHGVGVASGTDALILALRACGVQAGDEVLIPPFTFVATGSAVSALGAKPVFADIRPDTYNLDPADLARRVTPRTRAIIAVHLYGLACDMDPILNFARAHNLPVVEDNAQSIGASYKGKKTGSLGEAACMSFYPTKNLGAYGDAGMVVTNSGEMAARLKLLGITANPPST